VVKLIIHDFISNTLDLLVVVSKPKIVRKHYCYTDADAVTIAVTRVAVSIAVAGRRLDRCSYRLLCFI
jgi:hypothetical protein